MMRIQTLLVLLMFVLLLGCGTSQKDEGTESNVAETEEVADTDTVATPSEAFYNLPPDFQIWEPGTTFNDTSRTAVLYARTMGLEGIYRRAQTMFGEELSGMISVRMIIQPDGSISSVELLDDRWSDPYASALTDSMLLNIEQWLFPPGLEKPLALVQPFKFQP